jgi:hypothetical protein
VAKNTERAFGTTPPNARHINESTYKSWLPYFGSFLYSITSNPITIVSVQQRAREFKKSKAELISIDQGYVTGKNTIKMPDIIYSADISIT